MDYDVLDRAQKAAADPQARDRIGLPAVRQVFEQVAEARNAEHAYKKHTAHTKTSTKGCVVGCIGG